MPRYTEPILIPMTPEMAAEIRRRAERDERPVAAYVRLMLQRVLDAESGDAPRG